MAAYLVAHCLLAGHFIAPWLTVESNAQVQDLP
jgi:hypothetical protein